MFSGRGAELQALERVLYQTARGNGHHFLIQGERGIGKSSLRFFIQVVAQGDIQPIEGDSYRFLTLSVDLEPSNGYADIIRKVGAELRRGVERHDKLGALAKKAWDFLSRWEVMG